MAYKHGNWTWFELVVPDIDKGKAFYGEVTGWGSMDMPMGPDNIYTMLTKNEKPECGAVKPQVEGTPAHWTSYNSVDDVDAAAARVEANGGKVLVPGFDVPQVGRMALVADPEGTTFNLFKGETGDDMASAEFHWNELWAKDPAKVIPFYEKVLNFTSDKMDMPNGGEYFIFKHGDTMVSGLMKTPTAEIPSMWVPYIQVDDVDAALERAKNNGGQVHMPPMDMEGTGRFTVIGDNSRATIGLITPAKKD